MEGGRPQLEGLSTRRGRCTSFSLGAGESQLLLLVGGWFGVVRALV